MCDFYKDKICSDSEMVGIPRESVVSEIFHIGFTNPSLSTSQIHYCQVAVFWEFLVASANDFLMTWIRLTADEDFISQCCPNEPFFELQLI